MTEPDGGDLDRSATPHVPAPPAAPPSATVHRMARPALNHEAHTCCGIVVRLARATQQWNKVTCGNCSKGAPEGAR